MSTWAAVLSLLGAAWMAVGATVPGAAVPASVVALVCLAIAAVLAVRAWRNERQR